MSKLYSIIYADPPWLYDNRKNKLASMGGFSYPPMSQSDLMNLPIAKIANKDCAMFMWATMPKLQEALDVMKAWGFVYRTVAFVWVKQNPKHGGIYSGLGHWTCGNAELVLFGKRGCPKRVVKNVKQIVMVPRGSHSCKPSEVRKRIVALMGDLPRIELFAREEQNDIEGWDRTGVDFDGLSIGDFLVRGKNESNSNMDQHALAQMVEIKVE